MINKQQFVNCLYRRQISVHAARRLLGLSYPNFTIHQLRHAYRKAALTSHPDLENGNHDAFLQVTEAYEVLLTHSSGKVETVVSADEELAFRQACRDWLGLPPEIVEESKQCPNFRQWLSGRTDSAHAWRVFFALHGGLAPMLRPKPLLPDKDCNVESGSDRDKMRSDNETRTVNRRRRR
jgi:hypothetical protein